MRPRIQFREAGIGRGLRGVPRSHCGAVTVWIVTVTFASGDPVEIEVETHFQASAEMAARNHFRARSPVSVSARRMREVA